MKTAVDAIRKRIGGNRFNALVSVFDHGLVSGTNFLTALFLGRVLPKEDFGMYILMFSVWLFINNLQIGFINQGLYVLSHDGGDSYRRNMPLVQLAFSFSVLAILLVLSVVFSMIFNEISLMCALSFSAAMFFMTLKEYVRNAGIADMRMLSVSLLDGFFLITALVLLSLQYLSGKTDLAWIWLNFAVSSLAVLVPGFFLSKKPLRFNPAEFRKAFCENLSFVRWTTLTNILIWGNSNLYKFIVTGFLGLSTIAAVGACQYVTFLLNPILNGLQNFGVSFLAGKRAKSIEAYEKAYKKYFIGLMLLVFTILVPLFCFPGFFLYLFYGGKYAGYELTLQIFCFGLLVSVAARVMNIRLMVEKATRFLFDVYILSTVILTVALVILLYKAYFKGFLVYLALQSIVVFAISFVYNRKLRQMEQVS